jgi:hypothetical protein
MPGYDTIRLLFGKDYRDEPEVRRALEIADTEFRQKFGTEVDYSPEHKKYLQRRAAEFLTDPDCELEIVRDAVQRGMFRGARSPHLLDERRARRDAHVRRFEMPGGAVMFEGLDETGQEMVDGMPLIRETAQDRENMPVDPKLYGDHSQHPGFREKQAQARLAARMKPGSRMPPGAILGEREATFEPAKLPSGQAAYGNPKSFPPKLRYQR